MWCDVVEPPLRRSRFAGLTHSGCITPSVILDPLYLLPQSSPVCSLCVLQDEPAAQGLSTVGQDALRAPCHSTRQCDRVTASRGSIMWLYAGPWQSACVRTRPYPGCMIHTPHLHAGGKGVRLLCGPWHPHATLSLPYVRVHIVR